MAAECYLGTYSAEVMQTQGWDAYDVISHVALNDLLFWLFKKTAVRYCAGKVLKMSLIT